MNVSMESLKVSGWEDTHLMDTSHIDECLCHYPGLHRAGPDLRQRAFSDKNRVCPQEDMESQSCVPCQQLPHTHSTMAEPEIRQAHPQLLLESSDSPDGDGQRPCKIQRDSHVACSRSTPVGSTPGALLWAGSGNTDPRPCL